MFAKSEKSGERIEGKENRTVFESSGGRVERGDCARERLPNDEDSPLILKFGLQ
jgi:hypothetical protein